MERSHSLVSGVQRLKKPPLLNGNVGRYLPQPPADNPVHDTYVLCEPPARRFKTRRTPHIFICRTLGKCLLPTVIASAAWDMVKDGDTVSDFEVVHAVSQSRYHSRSFMAKDA